MQKVWILLVGIFLLYILFMQFNFPLIQQGPYLNISHLKKKQKNIGGRKVLMMDADIALTRRSLIEDLEVQYNLNDDDHKMQKKKKKDNDHNKLGDIDKTMKSEEDETQRYLRAVDEIANLMHRDYTGKGKGKRNPPINNHIPND